MPGEVGTSATGIAFRKADPSTLGTSATGIAFRKADPSTPVHRTSGRDDKMRVFLRRECKKKKNIGRRLKIFLFFKVFPLFFEILQYRK